MNNDNNALSLIRLGIDTLHQFNVYIHAGCFVCKSEGFETYTPVQVSCGDQTIIATLNIIHSDILQYNQAGLSESAWQKLGVQEGDQIQLSHIPPITSLKYVRSKIYGNELNEQELHDIIKDVVAGRYANIYLSSFITACARENLSINEIIYLTKAMVKTGEQLRWNQATIVDKHSVGGIPGNRTTPIVVAIVAAAGLIIPKTSSRAITSPAGTADTVETMTTVELSVEKIREVVEKEGGCFAWGGAIGLSPADDILIRVERTLDLDPEGQMIASVLSKKAAVGATDVVIDIPVGPTAKIRSKQVFHRLREYFISVGKVVGLNVEVLKTEGIQPLGIGIGPALEAKDILAILRNEKDAPVDLKNKAIMLAATIINMGQKIPLKKAEKIATELLENGTAYKKFISICEAQGGFREPPTASYTQDIVATHSGIVTEIDNRNLAIVAKLAGAPHDPAAGIEFFAKQGTVIEKGQTLYRIHAETKGELQYSLRYAKSMPNIIQISSR